MLYVCAVRFDVMGNFETNLVLGELNKASESHNTMHWSMTLEIDGVMLHVGSPKNMFFSF